MSRKSNRKIDETQKLSTASAARIHLFSNSEALIEGCCGILEYNSDKIKIDIGDKAVCFSGLNLSMEDYNLAETNIKGDIISIEFSD